MPTAATRPASLRRLIGAALLALLVAQWTAIVHAVAHAPSASAVVTIQGDGDRYGHRADSAACQLIDHLLTGQAPGMPTGAATGAIPGSEPLLPAHGVLVATRPLRLQPARGPPPA